MTAITSPVSIQQFNDSQKRELLAELIKKSRQEPLISKTQERIWQLDQIAPGNPVYNFQSVITLLGQLNKNALSLAADRIVERHEVLRTGYANASGKPKLDILDKIKFEIEYLDWRDASQEQRQNHYREAAQTRFTLATPPLLRLQCACVDDTTHVLVLTMHHIVSDLLSLDIYFEELGQYYGTISQDVSDNVLPLFWGYQEFARSERITRRKLLEGSTADFWRDHLASAPVVDWYSDFPRPSRPSGQAATVHLLLDTELVEGVEILARQERTTPFVVLLSAFYVLQWAISDGDDQLVGVPTAGRDREELQRLIGMFSSPLPIRADLSGEPSFHDFLQRVRQTVLGVTEHADLPLADIVELAQAASGGRALILRSMFSFVSRMRNLVFPGLNVERLPTDRGISDFDLFLTLYQDGKNWRGVFEYNTDLFSRDTVQSWADGFVDTVRSVVHEAVIPIMHLAASIPSPDRLTISVAATFTADTLEESIRFWQHQLRWPSDVRFAPYNQVFQTLMSPTSELHQDGTLNVILLRPEDWVRYTADSTARRTTLLQVTREFIDIVRSTRMSAHCLIYLCPSSPSVADTESIASAERLIEEELCGLSGISVLRTEPVMGRYGVSRIHDETANSIGHIPFARDWFTAMGTELMRRANELKRQPYKVIALDCDNTLWSGVVAEDGPQGIRVDGPHLALQKFMVEQAKAGKLLCLVSKNETEDVFRAIDENPDMVLARENIVAHRINWLPKSENLRALASELQLGLDSFIFLDDNPVECAEVRAGVPEVLALCLPQDIDRLPAWLDNVWAFDSNRISDEDRIRAKSYMQNRQREALRQEQDSMSDFLAKLELFIEISPAEETIIPRLSQLSHRTNQFNNTGVRYDEQVLEKAVNSMSRSSDFRATELLQQDWSGLQILAVKVKDRFGDYGLVGLVGFQVEQRVLRVSSFLLSCRVLGRGVEHQILASIGKAAIQHGLSDIHIAFKSLPRNGPFRSFLNNLQGEFDHPGDCYRLTSATAAAIRFDPERHSVESGENAAPAAIGRAASDTQIARQEALSEISEALGNVSDIHAVMDEQNPRRKLAETSGGAPQGETEAAIAAIWGEILHLEALGRNDNFFEVGGNSLLLVQVNSLLIERFSRDIDITTLFQFPNIASLARHLGSSADTTADIQRVQTRAQQARRQIGQRMQRLGRGRREAARTG